MLCFALSLSISNTISETKEIWCTKKLKTLHLLVSTFLKTILEIGRVLPLKKDGNFTQKNKQIYFISNYLFHLSKWLIRCRNRICTDLISAKYSNFDIAHLNWFTNHKEDDHAGVLLFWEVCWSKWNCAISCEIRVMDKISTWTQYLSLLLVLLTRLRLFCKKVHGLGIR